jgi:hypothetical protein
MNEMQYKSIGCIEWARIILKLAAAQVLRKFSSLDGFKITKALQSTLCQCR